MSGPTTSGEFTVLASARREWAPADRQRLLAEAAEPGAIVSQVARRNGVAQSLLYRWRKDAVIARERAACFVQVAIAPQAEPVPRGGGDRRLPSPASNTTIEILLANGRLVRANTGIDAAALVRIVHALEAGT